MVSNTNYEHCLRQKLTLMANAIARIASIKSQLRRSAEKTRKDISNAIDHQLSCIRAREQELLYNLAAIVDEKEQKLCEREELLNQAIGACQQSLECLLESNAKGNNNGTDSMNVMKMLFKMNGLELKPKESPDLYFEYDPSDLRRDIAAFGRVVAIDSQPMLAESLPLDVEHYDEDGALLSHKSVLRLPRNCSTNAVITIHDSLPTNNNNCLTANAQSPLSDSIDYWLSQVNLADCAEEDFEYIRNRIASISTSSIEVINPSENVDAIDENSMPSTVSIPENLNASAATSRDAFYAHFSEINGMPLKHWLHRSASDAISPMDSDSSTMTMLKCNVADGNKVINKRKLEELTNSAAHHHGFSEVIRSIQLSDDDQWLLNSRVKRSRNNQIAPLQTSFSAENIFRNSRVLSTKPDGQFSFQMDCQENQAKKERCSLAALFDSISADSWLLKKSLAVAGNEDAKSTTSDGFVPSLDSVIAWQKVLERIHAANEDKWLSPSTRIYSKSAR